MYKSVREILVRNKQIVLQITVKQLSKNKTAELVQYILRTSSQRNILSQEKAMNH